MPPNAYPSKLATLVRMEDICPDWDLDDAGDMDPLLQHQQHEGGRDGGAASAVLGPREEKGLPGVEEPADAAAPSRLSPSTASPVASPAAASASTTVASPVVQVAEANHAPPRQPPPARLCPSAENNGEAAPVQDAPPAPREDSAAPALTADGPGQPHCFASSNSKHMKTVKTSVFLKTGRALEFVIQGGNYASAHELQDLVAAHLGLPDQHAGAFSLWLVSPLLEVQLKPQHIPFRLVQQWPDLLLKYSTASRKAIDNDEPVLSFQRNIFFSKRKERKVTDPQVLELLFCEARHNVLQGRYPLDHIDCDILAGIQAVIDHGPFKSANHKPSFYKGRVDRYLAHHARRRLWSALVKGYYSPEERISEQHRYMSTQCQVEKLHRRYLELCWKLPYYGCAFFNGSIEKPTRSVFKRRAYRKVSLACNKDGICVIDPAEKNLLLGLTYDKLSWDCTEAASGAAAGGPDNSCLFLQFEASIKDKPVKKVLNVFSKQAVMLDALIDRFVQIKQLKMSGHPELLDDKNTILNSTKLSRLKLATFDANGNNIANSDQNNRRKR